MSADLKAPENFVQLKHFEILSWLIANEYLDIKIAVPTKDQGLPIESDRLLAYKLRDTWKDGKSIVNPKKLAKDTPFINASRQYLTVNTPLKDLMFRHTHDTLRQYYQLGILDRDIPRRIVSDN